MKQLKIKLIYIVKIEIIVCGGRVLALSNRRIENTIHFSHELRPAAKKIVKRSCAYIHSTLTFCLDGLF